MDANLKYLLSHLDHDSSVGAARIRALLESCTTDGRRVTWHENSDINAVSNDNQTPLLLACYENLWNLACNLIRAGAHVNVIDKYGWTPLRLAFECKTFERVRMRMDVGPDENVRELFECVRMLLDAGADVNARDFGTRSLFARVCFQRLTLYVRMFVNNGADVHLVDAHGFTPFRWACVNNLGGCLPTLDTGVHWIATVRGRVSTFPDADQSECVRMLLSAGGHVHSSCRVDLQFMW